ncbi:MAG: ComEA family DNA-binding protein [Pyrinomonadaceae bacterium]
MLLFSQTNAASGRPRMLALLLCASLMCCAVACAKRSRATANAPPTSPANYTLASPTTQRLNLNIAPAKELEVLPGIGKGLAERIVEHREKYGPFRRAEHLMMVRGISETRFRAPRHLVAVE